MNKLFLSLALLVPTISSAAIRLETEFKVDNDSHKESLVINQDEAVQFIYRDTVKIELRALPQDNNVVLDVAVMKKNEAGDFEEVAHPQIQCEWSAEASLKCTSEQCQDHSYEICVTAHKE